MKKIIYTLLITLLFSSCDKDSKRVKYEVRCPSGCDIVYKSGVLVFENGKSGTWSVNQRVNSGDNFYLSTTKNTAVGNIRARVYVDGDLVMADESGAPFATLVLEGIIP